MGIRERYPAHNINIEYNHGGGYWALVGGAVAWVVRLLHG
jgi:hypothetical protein